jgi:hypothetical protein
VRNEVGSPIGAFYGLEWDGFFDDQAEIDDHATQVGAELGRMKFVDHNGDDVINADDRTILGSPHPDFTLGLDFGLEVGSWDFAATVFGTFGNEIWDAQKEFYVFRQFSTNVRADLLTDSWEMGADNTNAKYPRLDVNDTFSGQQLSSYYVEDGSYIRLRTLQVGYTLPRSLIPGTRLFLQAENLLTFTGYSGLDPSMPAHAAFNSSGDVRDQFRAIDRGVYPSNRVLSFGINATF